jgi:hypothetical protein
MIRLWNKPGLWLMLMSILISPIAIIGCAGRAEYRAYDPGDGSYHAWTSGEVVYYNQWEHDTHRHHKDYRKRSQDEQRDYWKWRHDHDHDNH